jgi:hypothetical protein
MGTSMQLQFSVALFVGLAAAMILPPVRRTVPRWIEALIWLGLIVTCWLAVTHLQQGNARVLTESAAWGAGQIVNTSLGLLTTGAIAWVVDHRSPIANAVVVVGCIDVLVLTLLRSHRQAEEGLPRVMLGEWIEVPLYRKPVAVPVPYAMDEWNRRAEHAAAMLVAAFLMWLVQMLIWARDVVIPQARVRQAEAVAAGRVQAAAGLHALRDRALQLQVAARAFQAGHPPAMAALVVRAGHAIEQAAAREDSRADPSGERVLTDEQVISIRALHSAQSIGWYGPIVPAPGGTRPAEGEEGREHESGRLAS